MLDPAGTPGSRPSRLTVDPVDDPPMVEEFQSLIPVELDVETVIDVSWSDVDTPTQVTASTNRSWATIDLSAMR